MDYIQDGGHGWFKVSIKQLIKLGIADRISSYSYWKGDYAYLEEDCDASTYFETLKEKGIEFPKIRDRIAREKRSKIRGYNTFGEYRRLHYNAPICIAS